MYQDVNFFTSGNMVSIIFIDKSILFSRQSLLMYSMIYKRVTQSPIEVSISAFIKQIKVLLKESFITAQKNINKEQQKDENSATYTMLFQKNFLKIYSFVTNFRVFNTNMNP